MFTIVTCAEDELAARISQYLFRRALAEESTHDHVRANAETIHFVGLEAETGWTLNRDLPAILRRAEQKGRRIGLHPRNLGGNALRAYRIVRFAQALRHEALAVVLIAYDRDGTEFRLRAGVPGGSRTVVVAEAAPEFDAWILCGFVPSNAGERQRLSEWEQRLAKHGIHPVRTPDRLTSTVTGDERDAKALLMSLLGLMNQASGSEPRVLKCLDQPLTELRGNGRKTGLPEFLDEACKVIDATQVAQP